MFYVTSEIYLNNDLGSLAVSVDNYPQKRKNHLTITYSDYMAAPLHHPEDQAVRQYLAEYPEGFHGKAVYGNFLSGHAVPDSL